MPKLRLTTDNADIERDYANHVPIKIICEEYGIKRGTLYRIVTSSRLQRRKPSPKTQPVH